VSLVLVRYSVCAFLDSLVDACGGKSEIGGIFIGAYRGPHIEVLQYTTPGARDMSGAFSFIRRDAHHQRKANNAWRSSGRLHTYVGEWHTHPSGLPFPSSIDRKAWQGAQRHAGTKCVFVVVSPAGWKCFVTASQSHELAFVEHGNTGIVFGNQSGTERDAEVEKYFLLS